MASIDDRLLARRERKDPHRSNSGAGFTVLVLARQMWRSKARFFSIMSSTFFGVTAATFALSIGGAEDKFEYSLQFAAIACLLVGIVTISQSVQVAAEEAKNDYSLLLANGFPPSMLFHVVSLQAALAALVGSILGAIVGWLTTVIAAPLLSGQEIEGFDNIHVVTSPWVFILTITGGVLTAVIAAWRPARMAMLDGRVVKHEKARDVMTMIGIIAFVLGAVSMIIDSMVPGGSWTTMIAECLLLVIGMYTGYRALFKFVINLLSLIASKIFRLKSPSVLIAFRSLKRRAGSAVSVSAAFTVGLLFLTVATMIGSWQSEDAQMEVGSAYNGTVRVAVSKSSGLKTFEPGILDKWKSEPSVTDVLAFSSHDARGARFKNGKIDSIMYYVIKGNPFDELIRNADSEENAALWDTGKGAIIGCKLMDKTDYKIGSRFMTNSGIDVKIIGETCNPWLDNAILIPWQYAVEKSDREIISVYIVRNHDKTNENDSSFISRMEAKYPKYTFLDREWVIKRAGLPSMYQMLVYYGAGALVITVSVFGMLTMIALAVMQRKRELGLLAAVGMSKGQMRVMIWLEAGLSAFVAGVLGVSIGCVLGVVIGTQLGMNTISSSTWLLEIWLVIATTIVGTLSAVFPGMIAIRAGAKMIRDE